MASDSNEIELDPRFFKPPNVIDIRDANSRDGSDYYDDGPGDSGGGTGSDPIVDPEIEIPRPPTSFEVVGQIVRTQPDGSQVVDVTLEVPDMPGVKEYEVRVAKTE